jgi:hypothetical protein
VRNSTSEVVQTLWIDVEGRWTHGPFFRLLAAGDAWAYLHWDGHRAALHPFQLPQALRGRDVIHLFQYEGREGPWAVTLAGEVLNEQGKGEFTVDGFLPVSEVKFSADGHRFWQPRTRSLIDLDARTQAKGGEKLNVPNPTQLWIPRRDWRIAVTRIAGGGTEPLLLCDDSGRWYELTLLHNRLQFFLSDRSPKREARFAWHHRIDTHNIVLAEALWSDGKAFWDRRGVLHLWADDPMTPQIAIALPPKLEEPAAVWASDGMICGSEFFIGDQVATPAVTMFEKLRAFVVR